MKRAGCVVESFDIRAYQSPLVPDIGLGDIRKLESLAGFSWVVTNLPYGDIEELAEILVKLGTRDRCNVALLVRAEWPIAKARHNLIHRHPWFHGVVMLTSRPRWVPREQETASPRHNFAWAIWGAQDFRRELACVAAKLGDHFVARRRCAVQSRPTHPLQNWRVRLDEVSWNARIGAPFNIVKLTAALYYKHFADKLMYSPPPGFDRRIHRA